MRFDQVIGNDALKISLRQMVDSGRLGHAILFTEENGGGAFPLALALSQYVNCRQRGPEDSCSECSQCHKIGKLIHPDLHFIFPVSSTSNLTDSEKKAPISDYFIESFRELALKNPYFSEQDLYDAIGMETKSGTINVAEAKNIFEKMSLKAGEAEMRTIIIFLPEKMNADAANKLLKLLEEPPEGTLFLLISHAPERLLQTIRSRCQLISLVPLNSEERGRLPQSGADNSQMREIFERILNAGLDKKLADMFPEWENVAGWGRDKQKEFCIFAENYIRKINMVSRGLDGLAAVTSEEEAAIRTYARRIKPTFYEKAFNSLEDCLRSIDGNVNAKLNFCDLCNRLLLYL